MAGTPSVKVYTMNFCPYCSRAKGLLKERGVAFEEILVGDDDEAQWDALEKKSKMKTMPQIFKATPTGDVLVGGYTELAALDQKDQLASLKS
jgi:glutaredoxin 3